MARIDFRGIAHSYARGPAPEASYALKPLDHTLEDGGAYALLGPSGCGKTTLLNIISGLLRPTTGALLLDDRDVTVAPPEARNIAQVFQFPVIYDTMTVFDNLAFPLRNRGLRGAEVRGRVEEIAALLELTGDLPRRARGLSADVKQKISLGRGLVRRDVAAILLDEPLTVIDPHLRWQLRRKLKQVHEGIRVTLVYVTHDQLEALTLADQVIVMNEGRVVQAGTPQELFERPAHVFVGHFIGSPGMNLLPCALDGDAAVLEGRRVPLPEGIAARARAESGPLVLGIRPEFVRLAAAESPGAVPVAITAVEELGRQRLVTAKLGASPLKIKLPEGAPANAGESAWVELPPEWITLFADGRAVRAARPDRQE
jgi:glycerol transport system ATP-binding protein